MKRLLLALALTVCGFAQNRSSHTVNLTKRVQTQETCAQFSAMNMPCVPNIMLIAYGVTDHGKIHFEVTYKDQSTGVYRSRTQDVDVHSGAATYIFEIYEPFEFAAGTATLFIPAASATIGAN